jgi:multicomponent Na+:H+ antiporter subunit A
MIILEMILVSVMLVGAITAGIFKDLLNAVIAAGFVSFIAAILFYFLHAPDVAMAEASIGAALTVAIFIIAIKKTKRFEEDSEEVN